MLALHDVLRDHGLLLVGYNKPIGFSYWTSGLGPLFDDVALGQLAHQVCKATSTPLIAIPCHLLKKARCTKGRLTRLALHNQFDL